MKEIYEMTSIEKVQAATHAYLFPLKEKTGNNRYAVYLKLANSDELTLLWFSEERDASMLPFQTKYKGSSGLPYYHFVVKEIGTRPTALMAKMLRDINPKIKVLYLNGTQPSAC